MNITSTDKTVTITDQVGNTSTHALNALSYATGVDRDSVTFKGLNYSSTAPVRLIIVNGVQMTAANIDTLLAPLFFLASGGGGAGSDFVPYRTLYVDPDATFTGDANGSAIAPFKSPEDALASITDNNRREIILAPYNYSTVSPNLLVDKNVIFRGAPDTHTSYAMYRLGNITVTSSGYFSLNGVQFLSLTCDSANCVIELAHYYCAGACNITKAYSVVGQYGRYSAATTQTNIGILVGGIIFEYCTNLAVQYSSKTFVATNCAFVEHKGLNNNICLQLNAGADYAVLNKGCVMYKVDTGTKAYSYFAIKNNTTATSIYAFEAQIGAANIALPRMYVIPSAAVTIINNTYSTSTTAALSAAMGKSLQDQINQLPHVSGVQNAEFKIVPEANLCDIVIFGATGLTSSYYVRPPEPIDMYDVHFRTEAPDNATMYVVFGDIMAYPERMMLDRNITLIDLYNPSTPPQDTSEIRLRELSEGRAEIMVRITAFDYNYQIWEVIRKY